MVAVAMIRRKYRRIAAEFTASLSALTFRSTGVILNMSPTECVFMAAAAIRSLYVESCNPKAE
jgi:hypothetical protein